MNREAILHISESKYCFAVDDKTVVLRLRVSKRDKYEEINVIYGCKYDYYIKQKKDKLIKKYTDHSYDYYIIRLELDDVRLVYVFELKTDGKVFYVSEDGVTEQYDFRLAYFNAFQLPYINDIDIHREVKWMRGAVFYQIFIDRFNRADFEKDSGYINLRWGEIPNPKSFAGGDIKGITSKLDYLSGLGINVLYLTPVFRSISNHKYDISDYYNIDSHFGRNEDFRTLVEAAHIRGIRIVLDAVFNHCSENLPQFQDVIKQGKKSPYHSWFCIRGEKPDTKNPNYEHFSVCSYMPKFNTSDKTLQRFLIDIAAYWIKEYDIDGWRLDVSDEVSHNFWRHFREEIKAIKPECVIIGENWHDANPSLRGDEYDSIMNYAFTKACYDFFAEEKIKADGFAEKLSGLLMRNTDQVNSMMLNILDSHDTHRFLTQVKGNKDKLICALAVMFMYIGVPGIYYGTEIGLSGGFDPDCRRTFDWEKVSQGTPLIKLIKNLTALKNREELIAGDIKLFSEDGLFIIERFNSKNILRLKLNRNREDIKIMQTCKIVLSYKYIEPVMKTDGFIIEEECL